MNENKSESVVSRIAQFIVDKRNAFYIVFTIAVLYCLTSISKVEINNDITSYLPPDTETRRGLDIMEEEFITYGTAQVMIANITYEKAEQLSEELEAIEGVTTVEFDETSDHFTMASALFKITFDGEEDDAISIQALDEIRGLLEGWDVYIQTEVGVDDGATLQKEMSVILLIAIAIIVGALLFTSKSYLEIPIFLIVFSVAAALNMGTNYWFGEISFVTNAIAIVLQLALAIDYAIILCHGYMRAREDNKPREATITALSKAIVEISASCLTTISGLLALSMMQFRIGYDMGIVLIKGIIFSILTVVFLMPGLLMVFNKAIDKTMHKNFVPSIRPWGRLALKFRYGILVSFGIIIIGGFVLSGRCEYVFSLNSIDTHNPSDERIAMDKIAAVFGEDNTIALLIPAGDYDKEKDILTKVEALPGIKSATGIANIEINPNEDESDREYGLAEEMTSRQFSEMAGIDIELARLLYDAYGLSREEYGAIFNKAEYTIPLIDSFLFLCEQKEQGVVSISDEQKSIDLDDAYETLKKAKAQLQGENWTRLIFSSSLLEESPDSFALLEEIRAIASECYGSDVLVVGNTTNAKDLSDSFQGDNVKITVLTIVFVITVLLFTFKSAGLPILLVLMIQGSIWINFSFPFLMDRNIFFIAYLIVSAIQMGATIDYAIVISSRYMDLREQMDIRTAAVEALNHGFTTVLTSGSILTIAGFLIYGISTDATIGSIGLALGRGTLISIILVMTVLPQLLVVGDSLIQRTGFTLKKHLKQTISKDVIKLDGRLRGTVSGYIDAQVQGVLRGSIDGIIESNYKGASEKEVRNDDEK